MEEAAAGEGIPAETTAGDWGTEPHPGTTDWTAGGDGEKKSAAAVVLILQSATTEGEPAPGRTTSTPPHTGTAAVVAGDGGGRVGEAESFFCLFCFARFRVREGSGGRLVRTSLLLNVSKNMGKTWDDIFAVVNFFEVHSHINLGNNASFIALVPKIHIISKVLAERLKRVEVIVNNVQTTFILDNPRSVKLLAGQKVDIEKTFDTLIWGFPKDTKWDLALDDVIGLRDTPNGSPTRELNMEKGVRQGDPLAPFLFIIAMEVCRLCSFLKVVDKGKCNKLSLGSQMLSNCLGPKIGDRSSRSSKRDFRTRKPTTYPLVVGYVLVKRSWGGNDDNKRICRLLGTRCLMKNVQRQTVVEISLRGLMHNVGNRATTGMWSSKELINHGIKLANLCRWDQSRSSWIWTLYDIGQFLISSLRNIIDWQRKIISSNGVPISSYYCPCCVSHHEEAYHVFVCGERHRM
ncbi:LOW QUALITY PROTEIN: hypothetical protein OSB04_000235, partial [Centaurea solstitialis]